MNSIEKNNESKNGLKKRPGRPPEVRPEIVVQYQDKEFQQKEMVKAVKQAWKNEGRMERIKSMTIYIKPEDGMLYYVINKTETGSIAI